RSPVHFNINSPIVTAAPVFSRYLPIIVPKIITSPMLATIDPTPDVITSVKLEIMGSLNITRPIILAPNPNKYAAATIAKKGCILAFDDNNIIKITLITNKISKYGPEDAIEDTSIISTSFFIILYFYF